MALTTFGAIMGFAAEMLQRTGDLYREAGQRVQNPALREALQNLLAEEEKNRSLMERTRRENVTEMILEPISGLREEDYEMNIVFLDPAGDADLLNIVLTLEERERRFFGDISAKIPLPEVSRLFRKMVQKKESNLTKLRNLESADNPMGSMVAVLRRERPPFGHG